MPEPPGELDLSPGRIVHFVPERYDGKPGACLPALVVSRRGGAALWVFGHSSLEYRERIPFDPEGETPYHWHWPERT